MTNKTPQVWQINKLSDTPMFQQLAENIRWSICHGNIQEGKRLPAIRQLAADLDVSPDTVRAAYKTLERMGLICSRPQIGTVVISNRALLPETTEDAAEEGAMDFSGAVSKMMSEGSNREEIRENFLAALDRAIGIKQSRALLIECTQEDLDTILPQIHVAAGWSFEGALVSQIREIGEKLENGSVAYDCVITSYFHVAEVMQLAMRFQLPLAGIVLDFKREAMQRITSLKPGARVAVVVMPNHSIEYLTDSIRYVREDLEIRSLYVDSRKLEAALSWADCVFATHPCEKRILEIDAGAEVNYFCELVTAQSLGLLRENLKRLGAKRNGI